MLKDMALVSARIHLLLAQCHSRGDGNPSFYTENVIPTNHKKILFLLLH